MCGTVAASLQPSSISDKSRCHQAVQCNIAKYKREHCIPQLSECNAIFKPNITMLHYVKQHIAFHSLTNAMPFWNQTLRCNQRKHCNSAPSNIFHSQALKAIQSYKNQLIILLSCSVRKIYNHTVYNIHLAAPYYLCTTQKENNISFNISISEEYDHQHSI